MNTAKKLAGIFALLSLLLSVAAFANEPAQQATEEVSGVIKAADEYIISKVGAEYFAKHYRLAESRFPRCKNGQAWCMVSYYYVFRADEKPTAAGNLKVTVEVPNPAMISRLDARDIYPHGFIATIRDGKVIDPDPAITGNIATKTAYDFLQERAGKEYKPLPPLEDIYYIPLPRKNNLDENSAPEERAEYMKSVRNDFKHMSGVTLSLPPGNTYKDLQDFKKQEADFLSGKAVSPEMFKRTDRIRIINYSQKEDVTIHGAKWTPEQLAAKAKFKEEASQAKRQKDTAKLKELEAAYSALNVPVSRNVYTMERDWLWGTLWKLPTDKPGCFVDYSVGVSAITGKVIEHSARPSCESY